MKRILLACVLVMAITQQALPYGHEGHQAVAQMAQAPGMLNQRARDAIRTIIANQRLSDIALWPDDLKRAAGGKGPLASDPEARKFNQRFPDNGGWHFVNLPLASQGYTDDGPFSKPRDIVHMINQCIAILETPPNKPTLFTKRQALRFLVHLVGDIHQPLHVATGYFNSDSQHNAVLITAPAEAQGKPNDRGGNQLFFSPQQELHAFWDTNLVERAANGNTDFDRLATTLLAQVNNPVWKNAHGSFDTPGDYHTWAEQWATDSLAQANQAYANITYGRIIFRAGSGQHTIDRIEIKLPDKYAVNQLDRATTQLAKGGVHLAALLNSIDWK
jgi:hypothetical protein